MPSWTEKPHTTPTIDVNLTRCACPGPVTRQERPSHFIDCPGKPILIPCPVRRSVTFEVVLGWLCDCRNRETSTHLPRCPRDGVRVSCSISGRTWEESKVEDMDIPPSILADMVATNRVMAACRERWELMKALVLGASKVSEFPESFRMVPAVSEMMGQRTLVFAALADAARLSIARAAALNKASKAAGLAYQYAESVEEDSEPAIVLADYVEHLIEQVGVLP